jgi:hypothetical protein
LTLGRVVPVVVSAGADAGTAGAVVIGVIILLTWLQNFIVSTRVMKGCVVGQRKVARYNARKAVCDVCHRVNVDPSHQNRTTTSSKRLVSAETVA